LVTNISQPKQLSVALNNKLIASSKVIKYLVISVSVIGRTEFSCFNNSLKNGIIEPFVHITLPALIHTNLVSLCSLLACIISFSPKDLQEP
jgi:hypothetical protein